jgi:uncharacterized membrane protein YoaT (DUF817 family)
LGQAVFRHDEQCSERVLLGGDVQVGFWNFVGGVGFWLSGFFGFYQYPAQIYQVWGTALSTFWGAWAFLIGSYIQLVETLN